MNICISGADGTGKSTLADKLVKKYGMNVIHSTAKTRNDLGYHLDLLDHCDNTVFDRHFIGELIFPYMYNREPKLTQAEADQIFRRVIDNNDIYIIMYCSDPEIIKDRLKVRGEEDTFWEVEEQTKRYKKVADYYSKFNYKNYYICDVAQPRAYDLLDLWIDLHMNKTTVNVAYRKLLKDILEKGHPMETRNIRGGTMELCNHMFVVNDLDCEYVSLKTGKSDLDYLASEILWYWEARNDLDFIGKFAQLWGKLSDDGKTSNSAYGYILQKKHGFNQIEKIIELLKVDPYSRRAVLNINVPNENVIETKDEMCTIALVYQIRDGKLHCTCMMRSNDVRFGLRNDFGYFIFLQKYIAKRLNVPVGTYTHFATSIHIYDRDIKWAKDVAYGDMEQMSERMNIEKLIDDKEFLIDWVDNHFTNKEDWAKLLRERGIIYECSNTSC